MVQADICKYIILSDTDRKKRDLQYPHLNVVHRNHSQALEIALFSTESCHQPAGYFARAGEIARFERDGGDPRMAAAAEFFRK